MTTYQLRDPEYIDLAGGGSHWRLQPRDGEGKWTESGGLAKRAVKGIAKVSSRAGAASDNSRSSNTAKEFLADNDGAIPREAKAAIAKANLRIGSDKDSKVQSSVWRMTKEEKHEVLADLVDDPLKDVSDEGLFQLLHGPDKGKREQALKSLEARRQRYEFLAETAHNGLITAKAQESWSKWDDRVAKLPGGKGLLKLKDRFLREESVIKRQATKEKAKELGKEVGVHVAVGSALVALAAGAAGLIAMKHGGDIHHAQHMVEEFFHGGPKVGTVPLMEAASWVVVQGVILGLGRKATRLTKRQKAKGPLPKRSFTTAGEFGGFG